MIFSNRDKKDGSVISFNGLLSQSVLEKISALDIPKSSVNHLKNINAHAVKCVGNCISYSEISSLLNLQKATIRRLIKEFVDNNILLLTDDSHPKHKSIRHYTFNSSFVASKTELVEVPPVQNIQHVTNNRYKGAYELAMHYSPRIQMENERFLSVTDSTLIQAVFSNFIDLDHLEFINGISFADILPHKTQLDKLDSPGSYNFPVPSSIAHNVEIKLSSTSGNLPTVDFIQILYTIINLTIRFNLDKLQNDLVQPKSNLYLAPIRTVDVLKFLDLDVNSQYQKRMVAYKIGVLGTTSFTLGGLTGLNIVSEVGKPLFQIIAKKSNSYKGEKSDIPFMHLIEWDKNVLKAILRSQHYFLLPAEVISGDNRLFLLYLYVRKQFSYTKRTVIEVAQVRRILGIPQSTQPYMLTRSLTRLFERYYKKQNNGKDYKSKDPLVIHITINVASIHFSLVINKRDETVNGWHNLYIEAEFNQFEVLMASQPPAIRKKLKPLSLLPVAQQMDKLKLILKNQSTTTPIVHNNQTGLSSIASIIDHQERDEDREFIKEFFGQGAEEGVINGNTYDQVDENIIDDSSLDLIAIASTYDSSSIRDAVYIHPEVMEEDRSILQAVVTAVPLPTESNKSKGSAAFLQRKYWLDVRVTTDVLNVNNTTTSETETFRFKVTKYFDAESINQTAVSIAKLTGRNSDFYEKKLYEKMAKLPYVDIKGLIVTPDMFNRFLEAAKKRCENTEQVIDDGLVIDMLVGFISRQFKNMKAVTEALVLETLIDTINQA